MWESMQLVKYFQAWKYVRKSFDTSEIGLPFEIANFSISLLNDMNECTNDWLIVNVENECDKGRTRPNVGMIPCPWVEVLRAGKGLVIRLVTHGTFKGISWYHLNVAMAEVVDKQCNVPRNLIELISALVFTL